MMLEKVDPSGVQAPSSAAADWSLAQRLGFRRVFIYLVLYNIPFPIGAIPGTEALEGAYQNGWHPIVQWIGAHVLHLAPPITISPGSSGDTTYNYVQLRCYGALTLFTVLLWSILDSRRRRYDLLIDWLRIFVRCALAYSMIHYGVHKVFKLQFTLTGRGFHWINEYPFNR